MILFNVFQEGLQRMELTFAEQVKILLKRRKMTIKDLASEIIEILKGGRKAKDDEKQHPEQMQHLAG